MELKAEAKLLRIFLGEADKVKHTALYEDIVREARKSGLVQKRAGLGDTRATRRDVAQALLPGAKSVRRSTGKSACATNCALQV